MALVSILKSYIKSKKKEGKQVANILYMSVVSILLLGGLIYFLLPKPEGKYVTDDIVIRSEFQTVKVGKKFDLKEVLGSNSKGFVYLENRDKGVIRIGRTQDNRLEKEWTVPVKKNQWIKAIDTNRYQKKTYIKVYFLAKKEKAVVVRLDKINKISRFEEAPSKWAYYSKKISK